MIDFLISRTSTSESCSITQSDCQSPIEDISSLYELIRNENNLEKYLCKVTNCSKKCTYKSEIERHVKSHFNIRPFKCPFKDCCKTFKREITLTDHIRGQHTSEAALTCAYAGCGKTFTTRAKLRYHAFLHAGEKPYKCSVPGCEWSFVTSSQLKKHEKSASAHILIRKKSKSKPSEITNEYLHDTVDTSNQNELITKKVKIESICSTSIPSEDNASNSSMSQAKITSLEVRQSLIQMDALFQNREAVLSLENEELKKKVEGNSRMLLDMKNQMNSMELLLYKCLSFMQLTPHAVPSCGKV